MGASIAAHITNAGTPVVLLDIVAGDSDDRSALARGAIAGLLEGDPAAFMHKRNAKLIVPGNLEDDMELLADCDWIIEAVIERLDIKRDLYSRIAKVRKADCIVSSNTSTLPLKLLTEGMDGDLRENFLISHFFNPPRYMRLLELVGGDETRPEALAAIREFADRKLGKGVVKAKDTPGFIANRIGTFWLQCAVVEAIDGGLTVEQADGVMAKPLGIPKTGVFGLLDLVGLDIMPLILKSMSDTLPRDDAFHDLNQNIDIIQKMIADGYTGRKGRGGFYRLNTSSGKKVKEVVDLASGAYGPALRPSLKSAAAAKSGGPRALLNYPDRCGRYALRVMARTLGYAASLVPEIADDIVAIDEAMRLGYNWKFGPFEIIDRLGPAWFAEKMRSEGLSVPDILCAVGEGTFYRVVDGRRQYFDIKGGYKDIPRPDGVLLLSDIKLRSEPLAKNASASLWDIGDGVACLEFHSKMNSLNPLILSMIRKAISIVSEDYKAMVIYNDGSNFSVGANLALLLVPAKLRLWFIVRWMIRQGQDTYKALKQAPFPVVGAPSGMALGGGCEVLLHCDAVQAHSETYIGLVEAGVGIIPGWGGCKEMIMRWAANARHPQGPMPPVINAFETISMAKVAKSADEARDYLFLRPDDAITMNRYRLLADAKARALKMVAGYTPPEMQDVSLPGPSARVAMKMAVDGFLKRGLASPHDAVVAAELANVLSGGDTDITETLDEDDILTLERRAFDNLIRLPATVARVEHMLRTGKPLRN